MGNHDTYTVKAVDLTIPGGASVEIAKICTPTEAPEAYSLTWNLRLEVECPATVTGWVNQLEAGRLTAFSKIALPERGQWTMVGTGIFYPSAPNDQAKLFVACPACPLQIKEASLTMVPLWVQRVNRKIGPRGPRRVKPVKRVTDRDHRIRRFLNVAEKIDSEHETS